MCDSIYMDFPGGSVVKNLSTSVGDLDLILGSGRSTEVEVSRKCHKNHFIFFKKL